MDLKVQVVNIKWDVEENVTLPKEMEIIIPLYLFIDLQNTDDVELEISEYVSNEISNISGYCHLGFNIVGE